MTVRLEPFGERHLVALEEMLEDPELLRFTRVPEPVPPGFGADLASPVRGGTRR
ncbi:MAG TPA: hypothetical protein VGK69_05555 [Gaiellaceae bacterium]